MSNTLQKTRRSLLGIVLFSTLLTTTSCAQTNGVYETDAERKQFTTEDGAVLSYLELGEGTPMVLVHGWSQSGLQWYNQIEEFSKTHRVLALDLRGHGQSSKVDHGYRIYRMAQDVREFMVGLDLEPGVMMGHSMGCSILWAYWDLYGDAGVTKMIFVDNSPYPSDHGAHSSIHVSKGLTMDAVAQLAQGWANDDTQGTFSNKFFRKQFTSTVSEEVYAKALEQHLLLPRKHAADLFVHIQAMDLRDIVARVSVPSLYVGGRVSLMDWRSIEAQANAAKQGTSVIFEEDEGGAHFMFLENPKKFNKVVRDFLK